jgi:hypothetical protein
LIALRSASPEQPRPRLQPPLPADINNTIWSYELAPNGQGTRVIESNSERELVEGMNASLAKIKAAAEAG